MESTDLTERVRAVCLRLPEATERLSHGSPAFFVRKQFLMLWADGHHDHDFPHLWCAGMRLDGNPDWTEVEEMCTDAYRVVAPPRLALRIGGEQ